MIDTIIELHPEIYDIFKFDIAGNEDDNNFGRGNTPTVEQIVRAAIYKEIKGYDYRELNPTCSLFYKMTKKSGKNADFLE